MVYYSCRNERHIELSKGASVAHSNESLYGIAGRIDKVDFKFLLDYDEFAIHNKYLSELFETIKEDNGIGGGLRVGCFGVEKESGKRRYIVSTWGHACDYLLQQLPTEYEGNVSRVDFRIESEIVPENISRIKAMIEEHNPKGRNVQDFSTRKREKEYGRNAGGKGLAFGSHKSDVRLTAYKRNGEVGAIEIQVSGAKLQGITSIATAMTRATPPVSFYAAVCDRIIPGFQQFAREMGFVNFAGLLEELGANEHTLTWSDLVEQRIANAKATWNELPPDAQSDFFKELQAAVVSGYSKLS